MPPPPPAYLQKLKKAVSAALHAWDSLDATAENTLAFLALVQQARHKQADPTSPLALRKATQEVLEMGLATLEHEAREEAQVLRKHFIKGDTLVKVMHDLGKNTVDQINRLQRKGLDHLADLLLQKECALREKEIAYLEARLPNPSYTQLFGVDTLIQHLVEKLTAPTPPWITALVGLGGIGKTSVADAIARQMIWETAFEDMIWLRLENHALSGDNLSPERAYENLLADLAGSLFPRGDLPGQREARVQQTLRTTPHLLIVDNLENSLVLEFILTRLANLTGPSKVLLTTRTRPRGPHEVFVLSLDELPLADAAQLMRYHAQTVGLDPAVFTDEQVNAIYAVTGGNPLALKLTVGLTDILSLPVVLQELKRGRGEDIEHLYRHIYWTAWNSLSPNARQLLQTMPLVAKNGARPEQMQAMSRLPDQDFWPALTELSTRALLDIKGTLHERRYSLHALTETFLYTDILNLPSLPF